MVDERQILHISDFAANLVEGQTAMEPANDADLGFPMQVAKDHAGNITKMLAKDKKGQLLSLVLIGAATTAATGLLKHDNSGNVTGGLLTVAEFNAMLSDGPLPTMADITLQQAAEGGSTVDIATATTGDVTFNAVSSLLKFDTAGPDIQFNGGTGSLKFKWTGAGTKPDLVGDLRDVTIVGNRVVSLESVSSDVTLKDANLSAAVPIAAAGVTGLATVAQNLFGAINSLVAGEATTQETHGWESIFSYSAVFDDLSRTLTIDTPTLPVPIPYYTHWQLGVKYVKTAPEQIQILDEEGYYLIYYEDGDLKYEKNPTQTFISTSMRTTNYVAYVYWNFTDQKSERFQIEPHTRSMAPAVHAYEHFAEGAVYISGLDLTGFTFGTGSDIADAQWGNNSGIFFDQDVPHFPPTTSPNTGGKQAYIIGAEAMPYLRLGTPIVGTWLQTFGSGRLAINVNNAGTWELQEADDNSFVLCHMLADNSVVEGERWFSRMGQASYSSLANAEAGIVAEARALNLVGEAEIVHIATVILQTKSTYANAVSAKAVQLTDGSDWFDWRQTAAGGGSAGSTAQLFNDLLDVNVTGVTSDQLVRFNSTSGNWENSEESVDAETLFDTDVEDAELDVFYRGADVVTNGRFEDWTADNPDGWIVTEVGVGNEISEDANGARIESDGTNVQMIQAGKLTSGVTYRFEVDLYEVNSGSLSIQAGTAAALEVVGSVGMTGFALTADGAGITIKRNGVTDIVIRSITVQPVLPTKRTSQPEQLDFVQNLFAPSQDISDAEWTKVRATIDSATGVDSPVIDEDTLLPVPFEGIIASGDANTHYIQQDRDLTAEKHVIRLSLKHGAESWFRIRCVTAVMDAWLDVENALPGTITGDGAQLAFIKHANGVEALFEFTAAAGTNVIWLYTADADGSVSFAGDGVSISTYITGIQIVKGTIAQNYPYVKTTSAPEPGRSIYRPVIPLVRNNADVDMSAIEDGFTLIWSASEGKFLTAAGGSSDPSEGGKKKQNVGTDAWEIPQLSIVGGTQYEYYDGYSDDGQQAYFKRFGSVVNGDVLVTSGATQLIDGTGMTIVIGIVFEFPVSARNPETVSAYQTVRLNTSTGAIDIQDVGSNTISAARARYVK